MISWKDTSWCLQKRPGVWKETYWFPLKETYWCLQKKPTDFHKRNLLMSAEVSYWCLHTSTPGCAAAPRQDPHTHIEWQTHRQSEERVYILEVALQRDLLMSAKGDLLISWKNTSWCVQKRPDMCKRNLLITTKETYWWYLEKIPPDVYKRDLVCEKKHTDFH